MRVHILLGLLLLSVLTPMAKAQSPNISTAEQEWPGEPVDNHVHMTWAALTLEVNGWADDFPEIVDLVDVGDSELGKTLWVVRLSDWSMETKSDGSPKEVVYIDGGHHGNEYLGTALAWLSAKWYIEGWNEGNEEAIEVLQTTEVHVLIMLNPDGNDIDTRWNINQVDLNRNYDHYWNTCPTTQPGSSAFSESETAANSAYMNAEVADADLYVTMHTGVWIMLYPWGKWPEQPSDWELFHGIREDVHNNISEIPIQNANQGLYPNCGTSRDYGYGVMGFPTFTFETDDEQFVPGSFEAINERLEEEMDVMRYLISNVWHWRARLHVQELSVEDDQLTATVVNEARASTSNATIWWVPEGVDASNLSVANELIDEFNRTFTLSSEEAIMIGDFFGVNATNSTKVTFNLPDEVSFEGTFVLVYQKRVIDSSMAVVEAVERLDVSFTNSEEENWLGGWGIFDPSAFLISLLAAAWWASRR